METTLFDSQELDSLVVTDSSLNNKYSQKVHSPIYTPRNINREGAIWECYNSSKYDRLINIINASNVTKEQKNKRSCYVYLQQGLSSLTMRQ